MWLDKKRDPDSSTGFTMLTTQSQSFLIYKKDWHLLSSSTELLGFGEWENTPWTGTVTVDII